MIHLITKKSELLRYKQDILLLFEKCFKKKLTGELWDWAYIFGISRDPVVSLMISNGKVVGHYAVIAFDLCAENGRKTKIALSMTTMIDERYRQQDGGVLALANSVYDYLQKDGVEFVFAYPNQISSPVFKLFLGWKIDNTSRLISATGKELNDSLLRNVYKDKEYIADARGNDFISWRLNKPGCNYHEKNSVIFKEYDFGIDLLYFDEDSVLDDDKEYNLVVGCGAVKKNRGARYDFGVKKLVNKDVDPCDIASMMILSDVF
jgi:hypothetical protein